MDAIHCYAVGEYSDPKLKKMARNLKLGNPEAIRQAASLMANMVETDAVLVPIPSHTGRAGYTLQLACEISQLTGSTVADILMCRPHLSSYVLKLQNRVLEANEMGFQLTGTAYPGRKFVLIDNVVASGNTAKAAMERLPGATILALANDSTATGRLPNIILHLQPTKKEKYSTMRTEKKQGVILIKADGMTMAADLYRNLAQAERIWHEWIDVAIAKGLYKHVDFSVSDYSATLSSFRGLTDKQIGFLLQGEQPRRTINALQAAFARRQRTDCYDADAVTQYIDENIQAFRSFMDSQNPIAQRLNKLEIADKTAVEGMSRLQRVYRLKDHLVFDGGERIAGIDDVAWLFRHLQDRSIENTFAVLTRGNESMVLHLGIGNVFTVMAEPHVVCETARRFGAEKVWFVHNHPSGDIHASREDINIYNILKEQLGNILQPSVIINTNTGKFGVFNEKLSSTHYWNWYTQDERGKKYVQIPVYAFDKSIFHGKGHDRYKLNDTNEVATFLSTQRLGERDKYMMLALDKKLYLNGYFHLPFSDLKQVPDRELVEYISRLMIHSQAVNVILVGKDNGILMQRADEINGKMEKFTGGCVKVMDVLQMSQNNFINRSWYNEKMESRSKIEDRKHHSHLIAAREFDGIRSVKHRPVVNKVQIAVYGQEPFQSARIRCRIDDEWQMYRDLEPGDFKIWRTATDRDKEKLENKLSLKYFHDKLENKQEFKTGIKR